MQRAPDPIPPVVAPAASSVAGAGRPAAHPPSAATSRSPAAARVALGVLALVGGALFALVVRPFWAPLLLAAVLAAVFQRPLDALTRAVGGRRRLAGALVTLSVLIVIVLPFASVAAFAAREAIAGFSYLRDTLGVQTVAELKTAPLPPVAQASLDRALGLAHLTREQVQRSAALATARLQELAPQVLRSSGRAVFHTVLMVLAFYFLLLDGRRLVRWLWNVSPLQARQTEDLLSEFHRVATGSIVGTVATALLQGVTAGIGFALFGLPHALFFGLCTAMTSFIPLLGTALVWVPAVGLLALSGHRNPAIGLLLWCLVAVVGVEHVAKPFILRGTVGGEMHTGLLFLSLLGGLEVFGLLGVVLGPLIVSFFVSILRMIEREAEDRATRAA
ncbi:MAG: AI-2E family transporter [Myxococcales bacterium]